MKKNEWGERRERNGGYQIISSNIQRADLNMLCGV